jgi:signal transduction histidine kinase
VHLATVLRYALTAALLAPVVSATIGVTTLVLTGHADPATLGPVWYTWWLGDAGGALLVAPVLVLWSTETPRLRGGGSTAELAALALTTGLVVWVGFTPSSYLAAGRYPVGFLVLPVLVWPVVRFGPRVAMTTAAALSAAAVLGAVNGVGPWVRVGDPNGTLLFLAAFMGVVAITCLALAASVLEHQQAQEQLRATEERLRHVEEGKVAARDEFLSVAAHELRTPIASLQLATDFLVRQAAQGTLITPDVLQQALTPMASQAKRLNTLVNDLLDTVRIQSNRMDLVVSMQDVGALTERVASEMRATSPRAQVTVRADHTVAPIDPVRYEQVLRNLLDNAIKYGGGKIDVDVSQVDRRIDVSVRDHGEGIAPEHRERIFERFYQAHPNGARTGLGLGLHVSKHIVELHGGEITAEFPPDGGTRIIVRLPT